MLKTEQIEISGTPFIHNYSDSGFMIEREDGKRFSDAKDLLTINHTYVETDEPIPAPETDKPIDGGTTDTETQQKADALDHLTGGNYEQIFAKSRRNPQGY